MAAPWTTSVKKLDPVGHSTHAPPSGFSSAFSPPTLPSTISFGPTALFASMARCAAAARKAAALNRAFYVAAQAVTEAVVDDAGTTFDLLDDVTGIADFQRTGFTGSVGNGICDLCMSAMGYVWRDLSSELITTKNPLGDFIYAGGPATSGQLVMAEAKGSFAKGASAPVTQSLADKGYIDQVHDHVGSTIGTETIVHGYAVALRANPATASSSPVAFAHIAETALPAAATGSTSPGAGGGDTTARVNAPMALGNYRAVFRLLGASAVVNAVDGVLRGAPEPELDQEQVFDRVIVARQPFLIAAPGPREWWPVGNRWGVFMIAEEVAARFLNSLPEFIERPARIGEAHLNLPVLRLDLGEPSEAPDRHIQFPDGLAFGRPEGGDGRAHWWPRKGYS